MFRNPFRRKLDPDFHNEVEKNLYAADETKRAGKRGDVQYLIRALGYSGSSVVRRIAAEELGWLGDTQAVAPLIGALSDEHRDVRQKTAEALGRLGDARAITPLIDTRADPEPTMREASEWALEMLGHGGAEGNEEAGEDGAIPQLVKILEQSSDDDWGFQDGRPSVARALISLARLGDMSPTLFEHATKLHERFHGAANFYEEVKYKGTESAEGLAWIRANRDAILEAHQDLLEGFEAAVEGEAVAKITVSITFDGDELKANQSHKLQAIFRNEGLWPAIYLEGLVEGSKLEFEQMLMPGGTAVGDVPFTPDHAGDVAVNWTLNYRDLHGPDIMSGTEWVHVEESPSGPTIIVEGDYLVGSVKQGDDGIVMVKGEGFQSEFETPIGTTTPRYCPQCRQELNLAPSPRYCPFCGTIVAS